MEMISHDVEICGCDYCQLARWAGQASMAQLQAHGNVVLMNLQKINAYLAKATGRTLE